MSYTDKQIKVWSLIREFRKTTDNFMGWNVDEERRLFMRYVKAGG